MKKITAMLMAVLMLLSLAACGTSTADTGDAADDAAAGNPADTADSAEEDAAAAEVEAVTITDHAGNEVTLPAEIQRIVVCDILPLPSVLTVFFDSAEKIVGMSENSLTAAANGLLGELYPEILDVETGFMTGSEVNTEELMKLDPQVVFYSASNPQLGEQLTNAGFNAVAISVNKWEYNTIETLNQWIELLSLIFPENDKAETCRAYSEEVYNMVQERVSTIPEEERARVFFLFQYSDSTMLTSGKLFFGQFWADAVGAVNVAEELNTDNSVAVNLEQVYTWNPEIIFITNFTPAMPEDLYGNTIGVHDWSGIQAVQDGKVYKAPLGMYRSYTPGVDTPVTLLWYAKTVYPELFQDVDILQETVEYYEAVFGVTLTEAQAESIFSVTAEAGDVNL